jgi:hypothetical protein
MDYTPGFENFNEYLQSQKKQNRFIPLCKKKLIGFYMLPHVSLQTYKILPENHESILDVSLSAYKRGVLDPGKKASIRQMNRRLSAARS